MGGKGESERRGEKMNGMGGRKERDKDRDSLYLPVPTKKEKPVEGVAHLASFESI